MLAGAIFDDRELDFRRLLSLRTYSVGQVPVYDAANTNSK